jgi:hypothetical protein
MWLAEKAGNLYHHPYNLGIYENLVSVRTIFHTSFLEPSPQNQTKCIGPSTFKRVLLRSINFEIEFLGTCNLCHLGPQTLKVHF